MSGVSYPFRYQYEHCPVSATTALGGSGATGDYLGRLVCTVSTAATANVKIIDGGGASVLTHTVLPNSPGGGIGVYVIEFGAASQTGGWSVLTGAGVEIGRAHV